jgi:hypothetical protein
MIGMASSAAITFGVAATSLLAVICGLTSRPISSVGAFSEFAPFALETVPAIGFGKTTFFTWLVLLVVGIMVEYRQWEPISNGRRSFIFSAMQVVLDLETLHLSVRSRPSGVATSNFTLGLLAPAA